MMQSITLMIYAIVVWTQLPETAPAITTPKQKLEVASSPKQFVRKHYAVFGLMASTLPISFFYAQTETNYRIFAEHVFPNFVFILAFISTCKAIFGNHSTNFPRKMVRTIFHDENHPYFLAPAIR